MNDGTLIFFIDSFPFYALAQTEYLSQFPLQYKVTPGFGYSINLQAEIFSGKTPDELGFFCQWQYAPDRSRLRNWKPFFRLISLVRSIYYADRVLHKVIQKCTGPIGNLPFAYLPFLQDVPADVFEEGFQSSSLFTEFPHIKLISYRQYSHMPFGKKDEGVYEGTLNAIGTGENIVATFVDLDGLAHRCGINSVIYQKRIKELDGWIYRLSELFFQKNPQGTVVVVSDHGIAPVTSGVNLELEKIFGKPSSKRYFYFLDATILRIWSFERSIFREIESFLNEVPEGCVVSDEERRSYGLTELSLGNLIFQLNEELMFQPSFWGRGLSHAMHGYHPRFESQKGIFLINKGNRADNASIALAQEKRTTEIYQILYSLIKEAAG